MKRLIDHINLCAQVGDKNAHALATRRLEEFRQLLDGDPRNERPEVLREKWGTSSEAESGARAMMSLPGVSGFILDDEEVAAPGE